MRLRNNWVCALTGMKEAGVFHACAQYGVLLLVSARFCVCLHFSVHTFLPQMVCRKSHSCAESRNKGCKLKGSKNHATEGSALWQHLLFYWAFDVEPTCLPCTCMEVACRGAGSFAELRSTEVCHRLPTRRVSYHGHACRFSLWKEIWICACWKRLKGKNPEGKNFRKLLRRKQSSAKISKISRNALKSSKSDIFYLLRNLLKYLLRTFFSSAKFSEVFTLCVFTLWLFPSLNWPWIMFR